MFPLLFTFFGIAVGYIVLVVHFTKSNSFCLQVNLLVCYKLFNINSININWFWCIYGVLAYRWLSPILVGWVIRNNFTLFYVTISLSLFLTFRLLKLLTYLNLRSLYHNCLYNFNFRWCRRIYLDSLILLSLLLNKLWRGNFGIRFLSLLHLFSIHSRCILAICSCHFFVRLIAWPLNGSWYDFDEVEFHSKMQILYLIHEFLWISKLSKLSLQVCKHNMQRDHMESWNKLLGIGLRNENLLNQKASLILGLTCNHKSKVRHVVRFGDLNNVSNADPFFILWLVFQAKDILDRPKLFIWKSV